MKKESRRQNWLEEEPEAKVMPSQCCDLGRHKDTTVPGCPGQGAPILSTQGLCPLVLLSAALLYLVYVNMCAHMLFMQLPVKARG